MDTGASFRGERRVFSPVARPCSSARSSRTGRTGEGRPPEARRHDRPAQTGPVKPGRGPSLIVTTPPRFASAGTRPLRPPATPGTTRPARKILAGRPNKRPISLLSVGRPARPGTAGYGPGYGRGSTDGHRPEGRKGQGSALSFAFIPTRTPHEPFPRHEAQPAPPGASRLSRSRRNRRDRPPHRLGSRSASPETRGRRPILFQPHPASNLPLPRPDPHQKPRPVGQGLLTEEKLVRGRGDLRFELHGPVL